MITKTEPIAIYNGISIKINVLVKNYLSAQPTLLRTKQFYSTDSTHFVSRTSISFNLLFKLNIRRLTPFTLVWMSNHYVTSISNSSNKWCYLIRTCSLNLYFRRIFLEKIICVLWRQLCLGSNLIRCAEVWTLMSTAAMCSDYDKRVGSCSSSW